MEKDMDVTTKDGADLAIVDAYNQYSDGADEPDTSAPKVDMVGSMDSRWNKRVVEILVQKLRDVEDENEWDLPSRSNFYLQDMIKNQLEPLRILWRRAKYQVKENGEMETDQEWEARQAPRLKDARHWTRRQAVSVEIWSAKRS